MLVTKLARVYAKALINLAKEQETVAAVKADMDLVRQTLSESRDLRILLASPVVNADKKKSILSEVFAEKISEITLRFLHLLITHSREASLLPICQAFENSYLEHKDIKRLSVSSAVALSKDEREMVIQRAKAVTGKEILLEEKVEDSLIGGLILRVDDQQYNGSLAYRLKQLERQLISDHYQSKL